MGKQYTQLTQHDRIVIDHMLVDRCSKAKIAKHLSVHVSTIYRELKRNQTKNTRTGKHYYHSYFAHKYRLKRRARPSKLFVNKELRRLVHRMLKAKWSPKQIEWHLQEKRATVGRISHETIYRHIYSDWRLRYNFSPYLRRAHKSRVKKGSRKKRFDDSLMIHARPEAANTRDEFGHWECDLMIFKRGMKNNLITLVERKSRFTIAIKNDNKQAKPTALAIIKRLTPFRRYVKSITFDQGSEFKNYPWIKSCLEADVFFCDPASPHQKGSIENRNGVIRTVYPRNCDIAGTKQYHINREIEAINERPMLCLGLKSPEEVFKNLAMPL